MIDVGWMPAGSGAGQLTVATGCSGAVGHLARDAGAGKGKKPLSPRFSRGAGTGAAERGALTSSRSPGPQPARGHTGRRLGHKGTPPQARRDCSVKGGKGAAVRGNSVPFPLPSDT